MQDLASQHSVLKYAAGHTRYCSQAQRQKMNDRKTGENQKKFASNEQNWKYDKIRAFFSKLEQKIRAFWDNSWCSNLKLEG